MLARDARERPTALEVRALARELLAEGDAALAVEFAEASRQKLLTSPELAAFHDDTPRPYDDIAYAPMGPRFSKPKWTPAPPMAINSDALTAASGEIDAKKRD
jgi:hypothetical protein